MIGNPPIIFLDEPSTGMDPLSRKFMWSVINKICTNRKQSSVILTTHSMEEAESLCRRIGIMVNGQFKCLGTSQSLKETYGKGYEIPLRIANLTENEIKSRLQIFNLKIDDEIDFQKENFSNYLTAKDNLGSEIYNEVSILKLITHIKVVTKQKTPAKKVINWISYTENFINFLKVLSESFKQVRVTEYLENNYTLEIKKQKEFSIGYIFGVIEDLVSLFIVTNRKLVVI